MIDLEELKIIGDRFGLDEKSVWEKIQSYYGRVTGAINDFSLYWSDFTERSHFGDIGTASVLYDDGCLIIEKVSLSDGAYSIPFSTEDDEDIIQYGEMIIPEGIFDGRADGVFDDVLLSCMKGSLESARSKRFIYEYNLKEAEKYNKMIADEDRNIERLEKLIDEYDKK